MNNHLRHPRREHYLSKAALALNVLLWLLWLPFMLRICTVPVLLKRLDRREQRKDKALINLDEAVGIITGVCNLKPFRSRIFPKLCLRQSLALYRTLTRMGYPVVIHFGVLKDEKGLQGHSWVTVQGKPVADTARSELFKTVYSHCSATSAAAEGKKQDDQRKRPCLDVRKRRQP